MATERSFFHLVCFNVFTSCPRPLPLLDGRVRVWRQADNMVRFRELYGAMPGIVVPRVLLKYSGKRVITSEWIDGEKVLPPPPSIS